MTPQEAIEVLKATAADRAPLLAEIERLRTAIERIKQATIEGRVCDDVAWFDKITTLHDFCEQVLNRDLETLEMF
jgi:hypothetical protein